MRYPVKLKADDNGTYLVTFPDVPGAITYGETKEEALERAPDALLTIFDALMKDRRDIPTPSETTGPSIEIPALDVAKIALYRSMREQRVTKAELARRLRWHPPQVDRLLAMTHGSKLDQLEAAFTALGKKLTVDVLDRAQAQARLTRAEFRRSRKHAVRKHRVALERVAKR